MNEGFKNRKEIVDGINHRLQYESVTLEELYITDNVVHIVLNKWLCEDVIGLFEHIRGAIICSQIVAQGYIAEHILKECVLDVDGDEIIMKFIVNKEFDKNDYKK